jgi:predicted metal-dependent enzyme (double-stranded beta helix superfamily)
VQERHCAFEANHLHQTFKNRYREIDAEQGFGLHLLHEEENHDLAVFVISWAPGKGLAAHNHKTWAVVAGIEGQEHETNYRRLDDGSQPGFADLEKTHEETLFPGTAVCCMLEDIHSVWNNGTELAVSLHTYGRHLNHTGRSVFDVTAKSETPCIVKVEE